MAHSQQLNFVKNIASALGNDFNNKSVLELGSYNVNGSIRPFFAGSNYIGVDLVKGPGVDDVADAHTLSYPDNTFDITISCECFEHNPKWLESFQNMYRMTKFGGVVIFTCASRGRVEHGTTRTDPMHSPGSQSVGWNYYKNLNETDFTAKLKFNDLFQQHFFIYNKYSTDLYFFGIKVGHPPIYQPNLQKLKKECISSSASLYKSENSLLVRVSQILIKMPILWLTLFSDKGYQNIAVPYYKSLNLLHKVLKK